MRVYAVRWVGVVPVIGLALVGVPIAVLLVLALGAVLIALTTAELLRQRLASRPTTEVIAAVDAEQRSTAYARRLGPAAPRAR